MKTLYTFLFAATFIILGCTEEVIVERIVKEPYAVPTPASFVATSTEKECETSDTTDVEIVIKPILKNGEFTTDTLLNVKTTCYLKIKIRGYTLVPKDTVVKDSIVYKDTVVYIDRTVTLPPDTIWQTVYDRQVVYLDTLFYPTVIRQVTSIPGDIQPHVNEFYGETFKRGLLPVGGSLIITFVHPDDLPGELWVSESFWIGGPGGQMYIGISESLPPEQHRASILRELARLQLKKKYVTDVNKIMSPLFPPTQPITTNHLNDLFTLPI